LSFRQWYDGRISEAKGRLKIVILGSYCLIDRLRELKRYLIGNGYKETRLVADFSYPNKESWESDEEYNYRKSTMVIKYGQVFIFVFFDNVENQGVVTEIDFLAHKAQQKTQFSKVLIEDSYRDKLSSMVVGLMRLHKIDHALFKDDNELKKLAHGACFRCLHMLM